jgi:CRP-like cAMP-binding protein
VSADALEQSFRFLSKDGRARLLEHAREERFDEGAVMLEEGASVGALFVIARGRASVEKAHLGYRVAVNELGTGDVFGEVSYLDGSPASASVVAREPVTALVFDEIDDLLASDPELARDVFRSLAVLLAGRLRFSNEDRIAAAFAWG